MPKIRYKVRCEECKKYVDKEETCRGKFGHKILCRECSFKKTIFPSNQVNIPPLLMKEIGWKIGDRIKFGREEDKIIMERMDG